MSALFQEFQQFRKILCVCPCCGDLVRVSDLRLKVKGKAESTWLDDYEKLEAALQKKTEKFEEKEAKLREIATEKGRKEATKVFNQSIAPQLRALKLDPFDIKPVLNPVDFIVFRDMNLKEKVSDIKILSKERSEDTLVSLRKQVKDAVLEAKYDWQVARIDDKGKIEFE